MYNVNLLDNLHYFVFSGGDRRDVMILPLKLTVEK